LPHHQTLFVVRCTLCIPFGACPVCKECALPALTHMRLAAGSISGDTFDITALPHDLFRPLQSMAPSGPWLFPDPDLYGDEVRAALLPDTAGGFGQAPARQREAAHMSKCKGGLPLQACTRCVFEVRVCSSTVRPGPEVGHGLGVVHAGQG